jgi:hypothetical protein
MYEVSFLVVFVVSCQNVLYQGRAWTANVLLNGESIPVASFSLRHSGQVNENLHFRAQKPTSHVEEIFRYPSPKQCKEPRSWLINSQIDDGDSVHFKKQAS